MTEFSLNNSQLHRNSAQINQEDDQLDVPRLSLKGFILNAYMWSTFQWIVACVAGGISVAGGIVLLAGLVAGAGGISGGISAGEKKSARSPRA